jgi:hypothetical protein
MEIRDSHQLSPEQKAQVEQHLEKLGTKEMTDLERADAKNFARKLREEVAEQGPGGRGIWTLQNGLGRPC